MTLTVAGASAAAQHAVVTLVQGDASVAGVQGEARPAEAGMPVQSGETLITGPSSGLDVALGGASSAAACSPTPRPASSKTTAYRWRSPRRKETSF